MMMTSGVVEVGVAPFIEGDELVIDIQIGEQDIKPVRIPISELIDDYIEYHSDMFQNCISSPNAPDAKRLVGILRLAAHTLETAIA